MKPENSILGNPIWDLCGFAIGLGLAWTLDWQTRDLVWGLWLSSLVIGYLSIVLGILGGINRMVVDNHPIGWLIGLGGGMFMLAFFTVHFGGFHFVHSVFLNQFFPISPETTGSFGPGASGYFLVLANYWPWLFAAALAERAVLAKAWRGIVPNEPRKDKPHPMAKPGFNPGAAYVNVVRMHLLIFFFAGVAFAGIESFAIYAVVYAVYFFPWSLTKEWFAARREPAGKGS
ncbi:MAG TPA: DUF6498-containing protein [Opitutaceae bacterium]